MAKKDVKRFVLSDETVKNSFGFYVATKGIKRDRFDKNPVMLSNHNNNTMAVLGRWLNLKIEGTQLTGEPEFDLDDEDAAKVAGKVDRGYIKGASVGLLFSQENLKVINGDVWLLECELVEGTITPIPSNPNALQLYLQGKEGVPLTEADVKQLCLSLIPTEPNLNLETRMSTKISLGLRCLIALGLKDAPTDGMEKAEIETHIVSLSARVDAAEQKAIELATENQKLKAEAKNISLAAHTTLVTDAVTDGKIPADKQEAFLAMDFETAKTVLDTIPAKANLSGRTAPGGTRTPNTTDVKCIDDFVALDQKAQLAFKSERPDDYNKLFSN
ncbi:hypothetical protein [Flavobacterium rivuli]|uniref:hypothetical protein n=1 Tax=Flavobacterium rivuli TaxID=498301 RepID=UPI000361B440|nr:hypothetical protein [Flavobacterium rivuli]